MSENEGIKTRIEIKKILDSLYEEREKIASKWGKHCDMYRDICLGFEDKNVLKLEETKKLMAMYRAQEDKITEHITYWEQEAAYRYLNCLK